MHMNLLVLLEQVGLGEGLATLCTREQFWPWGHTQDQARSTPRGYHPNHLLPAHRLPEPPTTQRTILVTHRSSTTWCPTLLPPTCVAPFVGLQCGRCWEGLTTLRTRVGPGKSRGLVGNLLEYHRTPLAPTAGWAPGEPRTDPQHPHPGRLHRGPRGKYSRRGSHCRK